MIDSGILTVYTLEDTAEPGFMPRERLVENLTAFYSERQIGVNRLYAALGANQRIDMLVRVWNIDELPERMLYCIPENGKQYRIALAQRLPELGAIDLTLVRLEENYDLDTE